MILDELRLLTDFIDPYSKIEYLEYEESTSRFSVTIKANIDGEVYWYALEEVIELLAQTAKEVRES